MSANTDHETSAIARASIEAVKPHAPFEAQEWLTFRLGAEEYGIDILRVQEIRSYEKPTRIANMPDYVKGVVNLRGVIVPILDLRMKLGMTDLRYDGVTVTIVLNVGGQIIGAVVDSVSDVLELKQEEVKPFPQMTTSVESRFITGIGSLKHDGQDRMLILMDIASLVASMKIGATIAMEPMSDEQASPATGSPTGGT
jgi:purine-binding chemotaxis protein CheW